MVTHNIFTLTPLKKIIAFRDAHDGVMSSTSFFLLVMKEMVVPDDEDLDGG